MLFAIWNIDRLFQVPVGRSFYGGRFSPKDPAKLFLMARLLFIVYTVYTVYTYYLDYGVVDAAMNCNH